MVQPSIWPLFVSSAFFFIALGGINIMHNLSCFVFDFILELGILILVLGIFCWLHDVMVEATFEGCHTRVVRNGLKIGFILFIVSEILFFFAFFWGFFHMSLAPSIELGMVWPPVGINALNAYGVPLINTLVLLLSGVWVTSAHTFFVSPATYHENKETNSYIRKGFIDNLSSDNYLVVSLNNWIVGDYFYVRSYYEPWLPRIAENSYRRNFENNIDSFYSSRYPTLYEWISTFFLEIYIEIIHNLIPSIVLFTSWFLIYIVLFESVHILYPDQHTYVHMYQRYGVRSPLGNYIRYWSGDFNIVGSLYNPIICNERRYFTTDFYDEGCFLFSVRNPYDIVTLPPSSNWIFLSNQTLVRSKGLSSFLYKYFYVSLSCYYYQFGLSEFLGISNSITFFNNFGFNSIFSQNWQLLNYNVANRVSVAAFLGLLFLILQYGEYTSTAFDITDSVYGSVFFVATGFHGFHVFIGMIMLAISSARIVSNHFFSSIALGFEMAAWYWHFVDVVWLFLYVFVYHWGS